MSDIIRVEQEGVEFFTLEETGESGMSISGLARLCGVSPQAIDQLLRSVSTSSCPKFLDPLQEETLIFPTVSGYKNVSIVKDEICATIIEWYAFESQRPKQVARYTYRKFAKMGVRSWIQGITGWQGTSEPIEPFMHSVEFHLPNATNCVSSALNEVEKPEPNKPFVISALRSARKSLRWLGRQILPGNEENE